MTTTRQIEIFADALEVLGVAERSAMIQRACADNPQLQAQVEELLAAYSNAEVFFSQCQADLVSSAENAPTVSSSEKAISSLEAGEDAVGSTIGPYKLLQRIGEGGCGTVYMAQQDKPVQRRVALKIIKLGMDTRSVIARFEAERQALAMMEHPHIARVLDAGATQTGRPFFVMELVHGIRITDYCDQNKLTTAQRLRLFVQVCQAIQHAHQKGIVHRDLKPSNVLVATLDGLPLPKVIDFGISKAVAGKLTDLTLFTPHGHSIGTPAYMSPEQAQLGGTDVDTRSDIYSLGVVLYELLTGRLPIEQQELLAAGVEGMRRTLREKVPLRPSGKLDSLPRAELAQTAQGRQAEPGKLRSELHGDLDWIVMKALEKDRRRRYETANGLARDIERYLNNEPVTARPPSVRYRFGKLVQRNTLLFTAVFAFALALLSGACLSTWLYWQEREARRLALTAEQKQIHLREEADRLRWEAENRQKLTKATLLLSQDRVGAADALVAGITHPDPNLEYADLYRRLGNWNVAGGRWRQAADRFAVLGQIEQPEKWDNATLDYLRCGPALLKANDRAGYQAFRRSVISRYAVTTNPVVAERVIKTSLLLPADDHTLRALEPLARVAEQLDDASRRNPPPLLRTPTAWRLFSLALLAYRQGDYETALRLCDESSSIGNHDPVQDANVLAVVGLAQGALGRSVEASTAHRRCLDLIKTAPDYQQQDYWFDWVFPQILLDEVASH